MSHIWDARLKWDKLEGDVSEGEGEGGSTFLMAISSLQCDYFTILFNRDYLFSPCVSKILNICVNVYALVLYFTI